MPAGRTEVQIQTCVCVSLAPFMLPPSHPYSAQTITSSVRSFLPLCLHVKERQLPWLCLPGHSTPGCREPLGCRDKFASDWRTHRLPGLRAGRWTGPLQLSLPPGHAPLNKKRRDLPKSSFNVKECFCRAQVGPRVPAEASLCSREGEAEKDGVAPAGFLAATGSSQEFD